jgi:CRP-like cAMP-binding protein
MQDVKFEELFDDQTAAKAYKAGEKIFEKGQPGDVMYVIKSGTADVAIDGKAIETLEKGSIVGEMALVDHGARSADVVAKDDCEVVPVNEELFTRLVQKAPFFALKVMRSLVVRLRRTTQKL